MREHDWQPSQLYKSQISSTEFQWILKLNIKRSSDKLIFFFFHIAILFFPVLLFTIVSCRKNKNKYAVLVFYPKIKCSIAKSYNENLEVYTVQRKGLLMCRKHAIYTVS